MYFQKHNSGRMSVSLFNDRSTLLTTIDDYSANKEVHCASNTTNIMLNTTNVHLSYRTLDVSLKQTAVQTVIDGYRTEAT